MRRRGWWIQGFIVVLLTVSGLPLAQGADEEPAWGFTDPAGDVTPDPSATPPEYWPPLADILGLSVHWEDETELVLDLRMAPWEPYTYGQSGTTISDIDGLITIDFAFEDLAEYQVAIPVDGSRLQQDPHRTVLHLDYTPYFYVTPTGGPSRGNSIASKVTPEDGLMRFHIPKSTLMGMDGYVSSYGPRRTDDLQMTNEEPKPLPLGRGSVLKNFQVRSTLNEEFYVVLTGTGDRVKYEDWAPDGGPSATSYTLRTDFANTRFLIRGPSRYSRSTSYAYAPGLNQTFDFHIENSEGPKRLIKLTYDFLDPDEAEGFSVFGPGSVSVPEAQTRNYTIYFKSAPGDHAPVRVRILGQSLGTSDLGALILTFENGTVLDATHNVLQLYAKPRITSENDPCHTLNTCMGRGWMSSRPNPPGLQAEGLVATGSDYEGFRADMPVGAPFAFVNTSKVTATIKFVAAKRDIESVYLSAYLRYESPFSTRGSFYASSGYKTAPVSAAGSVITFDLRFDPDDFVQDGGGTFSLKINADPTYTASSVEGAANPIGISVKESFVTLPLTEVPEEFRKDAVRSPFQISLRGDRDEWVNPGRAHLFNVTVLNFDAVEQRMRVETTATAPWTIEVLPASAFDLDPGRMVSLGILITAPQDANLNDVVKFRVNATADAAPPVGVTMGLTVLAPGTGTDFPDQRGYYRRDKDDQEIIVKPPRESPGLVALGTLMVGLALAVATRRRRGL